MKVQNAAGWIQWSGEAPTRSVQQGAACGFADPGAYVDEEFDGPDDMAPPPRGGWLAA